MRLSRQWQSKTENSKTEKVKQKIKEQAVNRRLSAGHSLFLWYLLYMNRPDLLILTSLYSKPIKDSVSQHIIHIEIIGKMLYNKGKAWQVIKF